jgi:hypothetical protein
MADSANPRAEDPEMEICPRCHRKRVVLLRSMSRHSDLEWFKCDGCEHLFTRQPATGEPAADAPAADAPAAPDIAAS